MAASAALAGVTALVVARSGDAVDYRRVLEARLASLGARVAQRLGREVTHVVFRRDCGAERAAEDAHLRELFERAARAQARTVASKWCRRRAFPSQLNQNSCLSWRTRLLVCKHDGCAAAVLRPCVCCMCTQCFPCVF